MDPFTSENTDREEAILRAQAFLVLLQSLAGAGAVACLVALLSWGLVRSGAVSVQPISGLVIWSSLCLSGGFILARSVKRKWPLKRFRPLAVRMVDALLWQRIIESRAFHGAIIVAPDRVWIGEDVTLAPGGTLIAGSAVIEQGASLSAETSVGDGVWVGQRARLEAFCELGPRSRIAPHARIANSRVGADVTIGEGADIRGCTIGAGATIEPNACLDGVTITAVAVAPSSAPTGRRPS